MKRLTVLLVLLCCCPVYAGDKPYLFPTYNELFNWMNRECEATLAGVAHIRVDDDNYKIEVLGSDRPVMVLFYSNKNKASQGLAVLARLLGEKFPGIKLCAYRYAAAGKLADRDFETLQQKYPLEEQPAILFYDHDAGQTEYLGQCRSGITTLSSLDNLVKHYFEAIPAHMLD